MANIKLISAKSTESPVTLTEFKNHIGFPAADVSRDAGFTLILEAATDDAQKYTGRQFMLSDYQLIESGFKYKFKIPLNPVSEVANIMYFDETNQEQTLDSSKYMVNLFTEPVEIEIINAPSVYTERVDVVKVNFKAGYAAAANVPAAIKAAILLSAADLYVNPSDAVRTMPTASRNLLRNYRLFQP
jgi:uncharacterized phiE125 gp8 family phage protein